MREKVKASFHKFFEEIEVEKPSHQKQRPWPIIPTMVLLAMIAVGLIYYESGRMQNYLQEQQASSVEQSIFDLKNVYVGDNKVAAQIADYMLPEAKIDYYELHTKHEPYGVTIHLQEPLDEALKLKYAFYLFALVQNAGHVSFYMEETPWYVERSAIENEFSFASIADESKLLTYYYKELIHFIDLPQIQTIAQHVYKPFFIFRAAGELTNKPLTEAPQYAFYLDEQQYMLWLGETEAFFINTDAPMEVMRVIGKPLEDVQQFLAQEQ